MNRILFWKLFLIVGTGVVALFYLIDIAVTQIESDMSMLQESDVTRLNAWRDSAEKLLEAGNDEALEKWLSELQRKENIWAAVTRAEITHLAGNTSRRDEYTGYNMGRSTEWQIHLYLDYFPIMELPFSDEKTSLLVELPERMRPGSYWTITRVSLQVFLPLILLITLSYVLYRHIMSPLKTLEKATRAFSAGKFDVRVREHLGKRDDELAHLSTTFDKMADRIGDLIIHQRQLITDLSHELRTPLTRLDIAIENLLTNTPRSPQEMQTKLTRVHRESQHIRKLVDDTLTLSWLENEAPELRNESIDLVSLLDVLIEDARFEFPDRQIIGSLPEEATIYNSNHRALGQAVENILRNALRYTPAGKSVHLSLEKAVDGYRITIIDEGPGVPTEFLNAIFRPFFRVDKSRPAESNSFGLGLSLAERQLKAISAAVSASNGAGSGLIMTVDLPQM